MLDKKDATPGLVHLKDILNPEEEEASVKFNLTE